MLPFRLLALSDTDQATLDELKLLVKLPWRLAGAPHHGYEVSGETQYCDRSKKNWACICVSSAIPLLNARQVNLSQRVVRFSRCDDQRITKPRIPLHPNRTGLSIP